MPHWDAQTVTPGGLYKARIARLVNNLLFVANLMHGFVLFVDKSIHGQIHRLVADVQVADVAENAGTLSHGSKSSPMVAERL
jgi:hypothetical protein